MPDLSSSILGLRPTVTGAFVSLRCPSCHNDFESYQPTVAGVAVGVLACPRCNKEVFVTPDAFQQATTDLLPPLSIQDMIDLTTEASRVTENWHADEPYKSIVRHRGVNLGEASERFLLSHVTQGMLEAAASEEEVLS